ncbi:MAG: bifunctional phosphoribosylaminoimidazolecarboxamide formyltransferase/inosine monophosphate cyclohydrolase [Magnetovibrio sp.]|nr:bifunctional phosphoribosylaminoimidazolecarboxamide formyltransferase/inosine monophosphate cyclohydrolase [Magnetovibrio sp.]
MSKNTSTPIKRALISVSNKTGLEDFCQFLSDQGVEILSTGGTANALRTAGVSIVDVSDYTGFPEIMNGRVKTLHPAIHGGLLAVRGNLEHEAAMDKHQIEPIDLLVVNLYPFKETVTSGGNFDDCIENIDIGGPALIRAAAKNHGSVTVIVDPNDYAKVMNEMESNKGSTSISFRRGLAAKAYALTSDYDGAISSWFSEKLGEKFPAHLNFSGSLGQTLRYGENPHQEAAFYFSQENRPGVSGAKQLQGKELSFNNINDTDAAFELAAEFADQPACVIVKHANPCGVAKANNLKTAYLRALSCDPESAFGGIIAFNKTLDSDTAKEVVKLFAEVVIAPDIHDDAQKIFAAKANLRILTTGTMSDPTATGMTIRSVSSGYLLQDRDNRILEKMTVVTKRAPTNEENAELKFAFTVCKHTKSNAIVYVKDGMTVGIGAGQMSRVNSARIAAWKAEDAARNAGDVKSWARGSVVASDAFFPFPDGLLETAKAGVTAVIQPGGSVRDEEVIAAADKKGLAMIFTGMRHFRH